MIFVFTQKGTCTGAHLFWNSGPVYTNLKLKSVLASTDEQFCLKLDFLAFNGNMIPRGEN